MAEQAPRPWAGVAGAAALLVLALAAWLRLKGIAEFSLSLDEATIVAFAKGVLDRGYAHVYVGTMEVPLATYELLPYPVAASIALLGESVFAYRLPSALFGTLTTLLIYLVGVRWFGRGAGLLAGFLYAVCPWAINWSQNVFHPAQNQFFALLTVVWAHRLVLGRPERRDYYFAALLFACAFLSWEGNGFLLPILGVTALIVRWGDWSWMRRRALWLACALVTLVVVVQGVRRVLLQVNYIMVGSGKSDISMPKLGFLETTYNPSFYLTNFFGSETQFVLAAVFVLGLPLIRRDANLRFVYLFVILATLCMTNLLTFYSAHYLYFALPFFMLAVGAASFKIFECRAAHRLLAARAVAAASTVLLVGFELLCATPFGLVPYELSTAYSAPLRNDVRLSQAGIDYKTIDRITARRLRPGDVVVSTAPLTLRTNTAVRSALNLQTITFQKIIYDPGAPGAFYLDKYTGATVLRSREEFEDVLHRNRRVWVIAAPIGILNSIIDRDTVKFLDSRLQPVEESFDSELYLWEN